MYFLDNCGGEAILKIIRFIFSILNIVLFLVPGILIVMLSIDLGKAVISNSEDGMKKAKNLAIRRIIMSMVIFLISYIVYAAMNLLPDYPDYEECIKRAQKGDYSNSEAYRTSDDQKIQEVEPTTDDNKRIIVNENENSNKNNTNNKYNILLVGNSKTYRSKAETRVSIIFAHILKNEGIIKSASVKKTNLDSNGYLNRNEELTIVTRNGKTLKYLADTTKYNKYIKDRKYDIVILQEQTDVARDNYSKYKDGALKIVEMQKNKNAKIFVRTQWQDSDQGNSTLKKFNNNAEKVSNKIENAGFSSSVIYDGKALMAARDNYKTSEIYDDNYHPSNIGAYLSAACAYKTIFGNSASNLKYNKSIYDDKYKISENDFEKLNEIVDNNC